MAHPFFFSYSSADARNGRGTVEGFFDELKKQLAIVHGERYVGEGGFIAPVNIRGGEDWRGRALPLALNTSQVLICLQSPNYFDSEYCGKELEVFLRRRRQSRGKPPDCVIPVFWQRLPRPRPRSVPDFNWEQAAEAQGLYQSFVEHPETCLTFAFQLATRISNLLLKNVGANELPPLPYDFDLDGVSSAFASPELPLPDLDQIKGAGPTSVTFVYPRAVMQDEWPFAPPPEDAAVVRAAAIAQSRERSIQGIAFALDQDDEDVLERIKRAQAWNTGVVLMLTAKSLDDPKLKERFSTIEPAGVAAIVVDKDGRRVPRDVLPNLQATGLFHDGLSSPDRLDKAIQNSLALLRQTLAPKGKTSISGSSGPSTLPTL